ncbi:L,D-transpeptidase [Mesorhizobium atlanticum]
MRELPQGLTPPSNGAAIDTEIQLSRRAVLSGVGAMALLGLAGCSTTDTLDLPQMQLDNTVTGSVPPMRPAISVDKNITDPDVMYASLTDGGFEVPAVPWQKVKPQFRRQIVVDKTGEAPGTIVVHLEERMLYLVQPGGDAIRYGVGIGKDGFRWSGRANIQYGREWPVCDAAAGDDPAQAGTGEVARRPARRPHKSARRPRPLHLPERQGHRLPHPWLARMVEHRVCAMSSGCVRLINQDIIDLYSRVSKKNPVVVV